MKKLTLTVLVAALVLLIIQSCSKGGGGGGCSETAKTVTSDPPNGSVQPPAPGPTYPLVVTITGNMPAAGVTIEVKAHPSSSATNFFTETRNSTTTTNNFTITNTPAATSCKVDIVVTSKSCATNKVTLSYTYSSK